jgi:DNA helicase-2/ATP-dependent DNA helicase PcrA
MGYASKAKGTALETLTPPPVEYVPATVGAVQHPWSKQQNAVYDWFQKGTGNLVVVARAGSGKTTTIIEGVSRAPEENILLAAFNKRIAEELSGRVSAPAEAKTLHAVGMMLVREYWSGVRVARNVDDRAKDLSKAVCGDRTPDTILRLVSKLHTKAREMMPYAESGTDLLPIAEQFECEPDDFWRFQGMGLDYVCDSAYEAMVLAAQDRPKMGIDFADMIYLPLRKKWAAGKYDLVVVDEAQDMTVAQLDLARKVLSPGGRMCVVGDDRQAIYAFRGADSTSLARLKKELKAKTTRAPPSRIDAGRRLLPARRTSSPTSRRGRTTPKGPSR